MKFVLITTIHGETHAIHIDCIDEIYIRDYGDKAVVKVDYTIARNQQHTATLAAVANEAEAEKWLIDFVSKANGEEVT